MSAADSAETPNAADVLEARSAGGKVIRGGALRTTGYLLGTALAAIASVFLLRYLGVDDFGRYVVVMSIVAIVSGVTDVGLTVVGQREYATLKDEASRRRLVANMVGIRLVVTPVGVLAGALFAAIAGYGSVLIAGVLLAGAGLVLANIATSYTVPLTVGLRFGATTVVELSKQIALVLGIGAAVVAGASLWPFFAVHIPAGALTLAAAVVLAGRASAPGPSFALRQWLPLLRATAPVAVAVVVNVFYVRLLVIMASLMIGAFQTGLFATSYRIIEVFVGIPAFMVGAAFPLIAHAAASDRERLSYALQRVAEVALLVSLGLALVLSFGAKPLVELLGGSEFADAAPVVAIQVYSLIGAFLTQVWVQALISIHRQRTLFLGNAIALGAVLVLGFALIPPFEAQGAAIAAVAGEAILACTFLVMLVRAEPNLVPRLGFVPKLALSAGVAAALALLLAPSPVLAAAIAGATYLAGAWVLRAVPAEVLAAFRRRDGAGSGDSVDGYAHADERSRRSDVQSR